MPAVRGDRLDSWKEIAAYLKRDVATARRWEKREALPVHRHLHNKLGSVYAYTAELDAWLEQRQPRFEQKAVEPLGHKRALWIVGFAVLFVAMTGIAYLLRESTLAPGEHRRVRLAIHRPGTVASLIASGLHEVLTQALAGVEIELVDEPGMMSTLRSLDRGQVDIGLAFNLLAFHAVKTDQVLGHPSAQITALTVAYATPAQIVVRRQSNLESISDLRGKRVSLGIVESGERFCSEIVLSHLGFAAADLADRATDFAPSLEDLRAGRLDAYVTWRGMPVPDLSQAFTTGDFRLISLDVESLHGLRLKHPFLVPWTIPARVYTHQNLPVSTVSGRMLVLASKTLSADLVERMMRAIQLHMPDLIARHPAAADITLGKRPTLEDGLSIDLHPGAEQYFRSVSIR